MSRVVHIHMRTVMLTLFWSVYTFLYGNITFTPSPYDSTLRKIPLPLIEICTTNGQEPTGTHVMAPEGLWGIGLRDNEYVDGHMRLSVGDSTLYTGEMQIRLRGNTSSYYGDKKPYKIKLSQKSDLLFRGESQYEDKDWVLLRVYEGFPIRLLVGQMVGQTVGLGWHPKWEYINLVINGDYKGDYILIESIEREKGRLNIGATGYLIEDDAYWWNEEIYFKGNMLVHQTGYTFKYPKAENINDSLLANIKEYILAFEDALTHNKDISPYIDMESFAAWLLAQDILGQDDSGGTNRYLYKQSYDPENPFDSPLKMGPLWDFDGAFSVIDHWSAIHNRTYSFYFTKLLERQDFYTCYVHLWQTLRESLCDNIIQQLTAIDTDKGAAIDASRHLDTRRWEENTTLHSLSTYIAEMDNWLATRFRWIDSQLLTRYQLRFVIDGETYHTDSLIFRETITYPVVPDKEGYTFSGWDQTIDIMPANDVTISASFITNEIGHTTSIDTPTLIIDLLGRRYPHQQQLKKGIYIIDRKKTIIR